MNAPPHEAMTVAEQVGFVLIMIALVALAYAIWVVMGQGDRNSEHLRVLARHVGVDLEQSPGGEPAAPQTPAPAQDDEPPTDRIPRVTDHEQPPPVSTAFTAAQAFAAAEAARMQRQTAWVETELARFRDRPAGAPDRPHRHREHP